MMDASAMYPQGFHPILAILLPDFRTLARPLSRSSVGVRYYYVDFGISVYIPPDVYPKTALGEDGRDQEPPELSSEVPYDPFKLDIFIIGNVFRREFCDVGLFLIVFLIYNLVCSQKFLNVGFFQPLVKAMTQEDPTRRPTADQALDQWKDIRRNIYVFQQRWRPRPRKDVLMDKLVFDTIALIKLFMYFAGVFISRITL